MIKDIIKNNKYCISIEDNLICIKNHIRIIDISESYIKIKLNNKIGNWVVNLKWIDIEYSTQDRKEM